MKKEKIKSYLLDNSAIIHLATMRKNHTNCYRFTFTLNEAVCPQTLRKAVEHITPRFPTIIAGIRSGFFRYTLTPSETPPQVKEDSICLATMTKEEIKNCALRVLYGENSISVEFFHSLTDGHGAITLMNTLLAEYLHIKHGIDVVTGEMLLDINESSKESEEADEFFTYAADKATGLKSDNVYLLPGTLCAKDEVLADIGTYDTDTILRAAKKHNVSVTMLLCAVMLRAVSEVQKRHRNSSSQNKPVQLMVPINLRKLFPGKTLRNFSLYALPRVDADEIKRPLKETLQSVKKQFAIQFTKEYQAGIMATHTKPDRMYILKIVPLWIKCAVLRIIHDLCGDKNSALTLTNLGIISLPEQMNPYVSDMFVVLTPRRRSPYNCGIVTCKGKMKITVSRKCRETELSDIFFRMLDEIIADTTMVA
ncbi:MAG: hypothetical protein E7218_04585 [Anaerofustis stercorihominis]|nr:hypothetical protein [Anaerofustis stercorihominis]